MNLVKKDEFEVLKKMVENLQVDNKKRSKTLNKSSISKMLFKKR